MKYKAIIFDLDGTIIDSNGVWDAATTIFIEQRGIGYNKQLAHDLKEQLCGLGLPECSVILKDQFGLNESADQIEQEMVDLAMGMMKKEVQFIEGFSEFHQQTIEHGLKTGIATNSNDTCLELVTNTLKLGSFFGAHIYNLNHVGNVGKPRPDLYLHVAKQLGVDPEECVAIEDSSHGVKAAVDAGMLCFGINTAGEEHLLQQAHVIIDKYHEIDQFRLLKKTRPGQAQKIVEQPKL